ncbi:MAG: DegT/DnrJ/EryC1/StrS family aminotransferase [Desulfobacteraceae bacterium]|nr:DegT/DnrJ/EryC1/StrS family aminotransferase [Desulfobacteraceae bacterium]
MIPYTKQWIHDSDIQQVCQTLGADFLTTGPQVERFEASLCKRTGAKHAVACSSGTTALHLACMAVGISSDDIGLTSPNSFLASANCIELCGGRADFVDIDPGTLCMDTRALEQYCRTHPLPRVVIPVDFAGTPADLPAIQNLAQKYGFLRSLRNHGMVKPVDLTAAGKDSDLHGPWYYEMHTLSSNFRITDFQCALGNSQLRHIEQFRDLRQKIVRTYNRAFKDDDRLILPPTALAENACPHLYPIQFTRGSRVRKQVYQGLLDQGISCQVHYIPIYLQPYYAKKYAYAQGKCPKAENYYARALSLPLFAALTPDQVDHVIAAVKSLV